MRGTGESGLRAGDGPECANGTTVESLGSGSDRKGPPRVAVGDEPADDGAVPACEEACTGGERRGVYGEKAGSSH